MRKEKLLEILHFSDIHPYDMQKIVDNFDNQQKEIDRLNKIIDRARFYLQRTCWCNQRPLTFSECNKLYIMLDKEELKEEGK